MTCCLEVGVAFAALLTYVCPCSLLGWSLHLFGCCWPFSAKGSVRFGGLGNAGTGLCSCSLALDSAKQVVHKYFTVKFATVSGKREQLYVGLLLGFFLAGLFLAGKGRWGWVCS